MNKKLILFLFITLFAFGFAVYQYVNEFQSEFASATGTKPANGHLWSEMECDSSGLCVDSINGRVGIGTATPSAKLQVDGNIIASDPTAANHVATRSYVDAHASLGVPSGAIIMFDTSCPAGWTRVAALDGRFPQGSSSYGETGVTGSHSHYVCAYSASYFQCQVTATGGASNIPYINVIWCRKN